MSYEDQKKREIALVGKIKTSIRDVLQDFCDHKNSLSLEAAIKENTSKELQRVSQSDGSHIKHYVEIDENGICEISADNLFTALLMIGIKVPPEILGDSNEFYLNETDKYVFDPETRELTFKGAAEWIELTGTVTYGKE